MKTSLLAALSLTAICAVPFAEAKPRPPPIPNTGGLPSTCPTLDDVTSTLKIADDREVIIRLREHSASTNDMQCADYTKIVEDGLQKALLAVVSQRPSQVCRAYSQPEVKSALAATFLVGYMFHSAPCDAFK